MQPESSRDAGAPARLRLSCHSLSLSPGAEQRALRARARQTVLCSPGPEAALKKPLLFSYGLLGNGGSPRSREDRLRRPWRKRKVRPKVGVGEMGIPLHHLHLRASCRPSPPSQGREPARWACQPQGPLGLSVGLRPSPQGSPGAAESRRASREHFRAAMTSELVPEINVPQTRQCGQGLRTYCKYQLGLPIFVPVTLWGAGPGQPLPRALSPATSRESLGLDTARQAVLGTLPGGLRLRV